MKLKNKQTGEIVYATMMASYGGGELQIRYYPVNNAESTHFKEYRSISELNEEWEDYEEPKEYWYIAHNGIVGCLEYSDDWQYMDFNWQDKLKQIGNYFETKEEAEKAVEKLKAWKRLKDKGLKAFSSKICGDDFVVNFKLTNHTDYSQSIDDFDCIFDFGGEE